MVLANGAIRAGIDPGTVAAAEAVVAAQGRVTVVAADRVRAAANSDHADASPHCIGMYRRQVLSTLRRCSTRRCRQPVKYRPTSLPTHRRPPYPWSAQQSLDKLDGECVCTARSSHFSTAMVVNEL